MPTGGGGGIVAVAPGPIGGTTSNTGQFTKLAVGTSVPTLPTNAGDATILNSLGVGAQADGTLGHLLLTSGGSSTSFSATGVISASSSQISLSNQVLLNVARATVGTGDAGVDKGLGIVPQAFASLPAAAAGNAGAIACVNNSNTNVWGATIAGGGANTVLAFSDGTVWTVAGK